MPNPFLCIQTVLFQTIQFSISTQIKCQKQFYFELFSSVNKVKWFQVLISITDNSIKYQSFSYTQLNEKTVLFPTIQLSISIHSSSFCPIVMTLSGATISGQSGPGSDANKEVCHIPQSSSISGASPSGCLVSYSEQSLGGGLTFLQRFSRCILQPSRVDQSE